VKAIVVGAGLGGLSAAAHLVARGADVTVFERASDVGGKAGRIEAEGFAWDTGPTLLTMLDVVLEPFRALDAEHGLDLERLDPVCHYVFEEGRAFSVRARSDATRAEIARVLPADAERWEGFLAAAARIWNDAGRPYVDAPFTSMAAFGARMLARGPRAARTGATLGTIDALARRHFQSSELQRVVRRYATYAGGDPRKTTAAFAMIAHLEQDGAWHVRGGIHAVARSLARAIEARGGKIALGVDVAGVEPGPRVVLEGGERVDADVVVHNGEPPRGEGERSLSALVWLVGVHGDVPREARHTVLFARDHDQELRAIFERGRICDDPTVYVTGEGSALYVLVNAPAAWRGDPNDVRARILAKLEAWCPGIGARIAVERWRTPEDIARTGAHDGAIYGAAPHGAFAPFERPPNRDPRVRGLFWVGGATHPGGGVPMVVRGGRFVADLVRP
jgi:phytoene desaturase